MVSSLLASIATLIIVGGNVVWYGAKMFLRSNGVRVGWFSRYFEDFGNLKTLAVHGDTDSVRMAAGRWLLALRVSFGLFAAIAIVFLVIFFSRAVP